MPLVVAAVVAYRQIVLMAAAPGTERLNML